MRISYKILFLLLLVFGCVFYITYQKPKFAYVSSEEILAMEKNRINRISKSSEKNLFFGRIKEANFLLVKLAEEAAKNSGYELLLEPGGEVETKKLQSLSYVVHKNIIKELARAPLRRFSGEGRTIKEMANLTGLTEEEVQNILALL